MARIKTYILDTIVTDNDIVIGSDFENQDRTKNFTMQRVKEYVNAGLQPIDGGTLKITTITVNDNAFATPDLYINQLDPALNVLQYEIVFVILNGKTWIFRRNDNVFGLGEEQTLLSDFTFVDVSQSVPIPDLETVLNEGNVADNEVFINKVNLYDPIGELFCEVYSDAYRLIYSDLDGRESRMGVEGFEFFNGANTYRISLPKPFKNDTATFQDKSGVVAYLEDIIPAPIQSLIAGNNITITGAENKTISAIVPSLPPYVIETQLYNASLEVSETTNGGSFGGFVSGSEYEFRMYFDKRVDINTLFSPTSIFAYMNYRLEEGNVGRIEFRKLQVVRISDTALSITGFGSMPIGTKEINLSLIPDAIVGFNGVIPHGIATIYL